VTYPAFRKRGEEVQVGDLVKHKADGGLLGAGLVTNVSLVPDLIKVLWSSNNRIGGCSRPFLEVLNEGG